MITNPTEEPKGIVHAEVAVVHGKERVEIKIDKRALLQFEVAEILAALLMFEVPVELQKVRIYQDGGRLMVAVQHRETDTEEYEVEQKQEAMIHVKYSWDEVNTWVFSGNRWVHQNTLRYPAK